MANIGSLSFALSTAIADFVTFQELTAYFNCSIGTGAPLGENFLAVGAGAAGWAIWTLPNGAAPSQIAFGNRILPTINPAGGAGTPTIWFVSSAAVAQIGLVGNTITGQLSVYRGGTPFGASAPPGAGATLLGQSAVGAIPPTAWSFLEAEIGIDTVNGYVRVRIGAGPGNGTNQIINLSGVNTANDTTNKNIAMVGWDNAASGFASGQFCITHVYANDTTGAAPWNGLLNDVRVFSREAVSNDVVQFTPNGLAANWQNAALVPPVPGTDFNSDATVGHQDTYNVAGVPGNIGVVYVATVVALMAKGDAGVRAMSTVLKSTATTVVNPSVSIAVSPLIRRDIFMLDPATAAQWVLANMSAGKIKVGVKVTA